MTWDPSTIGSNMIVVYASDETQTSTTSTTFQTKLTLSYTVPVAGTFMLFWDAHISSTSASTDFQGQILQDGTTVVNLLSGAVPANDAEYSWGGHRRFSLTAGAHTFAVQYRKVGGSGTIGIQEVHLSLWRIG